MDYSSLSMVQLDALKEVSNIGAGNAATALSMLLNKKVDMTVPAVTYDMLGAILTTTFIESNQYDEYILDIETIFLDDTEENIGGHFYYIPMPGSLEKILKSIGIS